MPEPQILEQAGPVLKERPRARLRGKVVQRALRSVEPNPWNPNVVPEAMMRSIEQGLIEDGWIASKALLVWGEDESGRRRDLIIDGEHMWTAALAVGITRGPMVFLDGIAESEAKALTVKLDQKRGRWDDAKLSELLRDLDAQARGAEAQLSAHGLGFTQEELDALLTAPAPTTGGGSNGASPTPPEEFPEFDEKIETKHLCPKCGYAFSGGKVVEAHVTPAAEADAPGA